MPRIARMAVFLPLLVAGSTTAPDLALPASVHSDGGPYALSASGSAGSWVWPVRGAVVRGYDPPANPYSAGHRGIDIAARSGTIIVAPEGGVVSFAGKVGGQLFVTIDHGSGVLSTCSYVSALLVHKGDVVAAGTPIARSGTGHPESTLPPHLHFGIRVAGSYVDPMAFLSPPSVVDLIRLAPPLA